MSSVIDEMCAVINGEEDALMHYGMPRRSGRYPWGSGEDPYQHGRDFLGRVEELRKQGITYYDEKTGKTHTGDTAIAKSMGLTTSQFRTEIGLAKDERRMLNVARAKALTADGKTPTQIGKEMGVNESTVRSWLDEQSERRMNAARKTADFLRQQVDEKGMIDIGAGAELELGALGMRISKEKLNQALYILEKEGYPVYSGGVEQVTNRGNRTTQKVLCPPGTQHKDIYNYDQVHTLTDYTSPDGGETFHKKFTYPTSMDSKRLMVRYSEEGGLERDGVVELRPGVPDLSLSGSRYSQVRIMVDGTHYIKGMAVYGDPKDFPPGVDAIFNTNKAKGTPLHKVLKEIKPDPDNPFGSLIKDADQGGQYWYDDPVTGEKKLGLVNKRADQGDWTEWADALPSQFLSKQSLHMAERQLNLAKADRQSEFEEYCALDNPTVKKHLLGKFADECDSAAVHLKAAALPGQKYHVIVPINTLADDEIYAPQYENGTKLALIRYPHGGTFEIPILTVNNKHKAAERIIGADSIDAVGINKRNADRLSGADFDGDTVMCIPTHDRAGRVKITSTDPIPGLEDFDHKMLYPERPGMKYMKDPVTGKDSTQLEMGKISNLITDMTLGGATREELARAVRHSMVVIDAGKHKLDYRQSEIDHNIAELKKTYQVRVLPDGTVKRGGASTIISRASGEATVNRRQGTPKVNIKGTPHYDPTRPEGALIYKDADDLYYPVRRYSKNTGMMTLTTTDGKKVTYSVSDKDAVDRYTPVKRVADDGTVSYTDKTGQISYKLKTKTQPSTNMAETDDAYTLVSKNAYPMEVLYADHANYMKSLANTARKEQMGTKDRAYSAEAKKKYQAEVDSLNRKLNEALLNAPRERAAQRMANYEVQQKKLADPNMKKSDIKKASQIAITSSRASVGSLSRRQRNIEITDREWEAIQAGAISSSKLTKILNNTDIDKLRERATPRTATALTTSKTTKIKAMKASGNYTLAEIAQAVGVSTSAVSKYLKEGAS